MACGILVLWQGLNLSSEKVSSPNHWAASEFLKDIFVDENIRKIFLKIV